MDVNHVQFIRKKQDSETRTVSLFMLQAHGKLISQQSGSSFKDFCSMPSFQTFNKFSVLNDWFN